MSFDELVARRGVTSNRSEAIRDLVREALVDEEWDTPGQEIVGTLTIVYDHHSSNITEKLDDLQHHHHDIVIAAMHVHLDERNCLEVITMRGENDSVRSFADALLGLKGVKHGRLTTTTTGKYL